MKMLRWFVLPALLVLAFPPMEAGAARPEPTPAPAKKPGFFERVFGGKKAAATPAPTPAANSARKAVKPVKAGMASAPAAPQTARKPATAEQRDRNVRLQVFLDRAQFAPGKISGTWDVFARRAWARFQLGRSQADSDPTLNLPPEVAAIEPYATYTVRPVDAAQVVDGAGKKMPYTSVEEMVAERYHCGPDFLQAINPGVKTARLKAGDVINVPNVIPFDLVGMQEENSRLATLRSERAKQAQFVPAANPPGTPAPASLPGEPPAIDPARYQLRVLTGEKQLEIREGGRLVASFPVTPGGSTLPTPKGNWTVRSKVFLPEFRHDNSMLNTGKRSDDFKMIPPGPNNPVGVMWLGLSKDGIGLHGTNNPYTIGRAASHGCVRLANWDVVRVANFVTKGTNVTVE